MTDYRLINKKTKKSKRKEDFFSSKRTNSLKELEGSLVSRNQETDSLVEKFREIVKNYRPDVVVKDPTTFASFGSAKKYYEDAFYNIVNYYPYDGTKKEVFEWYQDTTPLETAILQNHWPSNVGHIQFSGSQYLTFYAGPQSIPAAAYVGQNKIGETGLKLSAEQGNTVEFWMKKKEFNAAEETIFDIGTYPGKVTASETAQFKLYLSNTSGSPLYLNYLSGTTGITNTRISSSLTKATIADDKWHHYAVRVHQTGTSLTVDLYVDKEHNSTQIITVNSMGSIDSYMGGTIGSTQTATSGTLNAYIDDFRFWKGKRTAKQISRFFDQRVYASDDVNTDYDSRLGLYYRFNKPTTGDLSKDELVLDHSGNDIFGKINNYATLTTRFQTSAIDESEISENKEIRDPVIDATQAEVRSLSEEFFNLGDSYDRNNTSKLEQYLPDWVYDANGEGLSNPESEISILLHLVASEFDRIKSVLDSISNEVSTRYAGPSLDQVHIKEEDVIEGSYIQDIRIECSEDNSFEEVSLGNHAEMSMRRMQASGIDTDNAIRPLEAATLDQELDKIVNHIRVLRPFEEIRRSIFENIHTSAKFFIKRKGTEQSFDSILSSYGVDRDNISYNIYGRNSDIFIDDTKIDYISEEKNSLYLGKNTDVTVFLSGATASSRTYLAADTDETEYTFEGNFIFPERQINEVYEITNSAVFGLAQVSASNNSFVVTSPDNFDFHVSAVKLNLNSTDAKFVISSDSGIISTLETSYLPNVYENSRWHLSIRIIKDTDNKFINQPSRPYKVVFSGHKYILDNLENNFNVSASISNAVYKKIRNANKTIYLGARRTNITGSVLSKSDIKLLDFNAWNDNLSDQEIQRRAKSPSTTGRSSAHKIRDNHSAASTLLSQTKIFGLQFADITQLNSSNFVVIQDSTSGSATQIEKYGSLIGSRYTARSTVFSADLGNTVQREFLPVIRNIPLGNIHGTEGIEVKPANELSKFSLASRPQTKLFSFEKSMYQAISKEMVNFIGGLTTFNDLIGDPVNKYRKNYKMLQHLRQKFYEVVENESQFERYVSYFRWIDSSIGSFLEQLIPATADSNAGIENVVESHALERSKYDHKAPFVKHKDLPKDLETSILAINELLYDWEHGHAPVGFPPIASIGTISTTGNPGNNEEFNLTDADGLTVAYIFKTGVTTVDGTKTGDKVIIGVQGATGHAASVGDRMRAAISASDINVTVVETSGGSMRLTQNTPGLSGNTEIDMSGVTTVTSTNFTGGLGKDNEDNNCLWQKDRKARTGDRETIRKVITTEVSGSTYVLRNLVKPYKYTVDRQELLNVGSNRKANKIKGLYKIVNEGKEITINKSDIYEFKQCNDIIDPQEEKIYTAKTDTSGTDNYLDADADLILPFTLYSSSAGTDFENFKENMKITNNHDGTPSLQGPFVKGLVGGYPHRNVSIGTEGSERPEAYSITSLSNTLTVKQTTGPKSMFHRDLGGARFYHVGNVKTTESPLIIGNYQKDYEIVMTNGRTINNNYLVENEGANLTGSISTSTLISGSSEFLVPERTARDHVIVNKFAAPGSPESAGAFGLDRTAGEFSVYNTVNYRNLTVRNVENEFSKEKSEKFGLRSGSLTQASKHMTNRNPRRFTGSLSEEFSNDNNFVQHEIPQTDFGYSWITASVSGSVYDFLNKNQNSGHQHLMNISGTLKSSQTIDFVTISELEQSSSFVGLNIYTTRSFSESINTLNNSSSNLNTIILSRQGPSGWPTWRQIRNEYNPLAKKLKTSNKLSVVLKDDNGRKFAFPDSVKEKYIFDYKKTLDDSRTFTNARTIKNYDEMFVTSKFNPINLNFQAPLISEFFENLDTISGLSSIDFFNQAYHSFMWYNDEYYVSALAKSIEDFTIDSLADDPFKPREEYFAVMPLLSPRVIQQLINNPGVSLKTTVQNNISGFAQRDLEELVGSSYHFGPYLNKEKFYSEQNLFVLNSYLSDGLSSLLSRELNYVETIYPREINTYTLHSRKRQNFKFFGWNSTRSNRALFLSGNIKYENPIISTNLNKMFFLPINNRNQLDFQTSYFDTIEKVDVNSTGSEASIGASSHMSASKWVLDSRIDFSSKPISLTSSYFAGKETFLSSRDQASRGEGILQNDYSIFGLGYNGLRGAPPFAPLYNRRIPQPYGSDVFLAGEAKFETADNQTGPFFDDYDSFSEESKTIGQEYSLLPEFRMSKFTEDFFNARLEGPALNRDDFLEVTGAVYHTSSGDLNVGTQFFKTYSTTDFMKYFDFVQENVKNNELEMAPGRLTLRCQAVKKFLPYRGFYPAERVVQISEIFHRNYLKESSYNSAYINSTQISPVESKLYLKFRIENSKSQAIKSLMAPGVLLNSIKTGLAVDYPIFSSSVQAANNFILENHRTASIMRFSDLGLNATTCFTGSLINNTVDEGIPRISGSVSKRITFEDILEPSKMFDDVIYDNEPHPSASLIYGVADHLKVLERPSKFGSLDFDETKKHISRNFQTDRQSLVQALFPYQSAVNNFCAETVNFFLEDGKLNTAISEPAKPRLISGTQYKMRVYVFNRNTVMYDRHSAFGPPVDEGDPEKTKYQLTSSGNSAIAATARIDFDTNSSSSFPNNIKPVYLIQSISDQVANNNISVTGAVNAYDFPGFALTASNGTVGKVKYYEPKLLSGSVFTIKFQDPLEYINDATIEPFFTSSLHAPGGFPHVSFTSSVSSSSPFTVAFYDSSRRIGGVISNTSAGSSTDKFFLDLYDTGGSAYKSAETIAQDFHSALTSPSGTPNGFDQSRVTGSFSVVRKDNHVAIFSKFIHAQNDTTVNVNPTYGGDFITNHALNHVTKRLAYTSTSSTDTPGFRQFDLHLFTSPESSLQLYKNFVTASAVDLNQEAYGLMSLVDVDGSAGAFQQIRNNTVIGVNNLKAANSDFTITATADFDVAIFTQDVAGAAGNTPISYYGGDAYGAFNGFSPTNLRTFRQLNIVNQTSGSEEGLPSSAFVGGADQDLVYYMDDVSSVDLSSHGYLPFVPPFLDPGTSPYVELSFTPSETKDYSIPQIIQGMSVSYYNMPAPSNANVNVNYKEAMVLSASIDFDNFVQFSSDNFVPGPGKDRIPINPETSELFRWVIKPKWETPIVNFVNATSSALNLSNNTVQQVSGSPWKNRYQTSYYEVLKNNDVPYLTSSTGMWHQSGTVIKEQDTEGYYMVIKGEGSRDEKSNIQDLAYKVGFLGQSEIRKAFKLGRTAERKEVCEAVVAIPFYNSRKDGIKFFPISENIYQAAINKNISNQETFEAEYRTSVEGRSELKKRYDHIYNTPGTDGVDNVAYQLRMMEKYIIPPQFDFTKDKACAFNGPFVQYIFQFKTEFDIEDLSNMWQNIYPKSKTSAATTQHSKVGISSGNYDDISGDIEYVSGYLNTKELVLLSGKNSNYQNVSEFLENEVRWLVFKAKFKGSSSYYDIVSKSINEIQRDIFNINGNKNTPGSKPSSLNDILAVHGHYGYNWPYDYFSLVELVKLESKVDFYDNASYLNRISTGGPAPAVAAAAQTSQRRQEQGQQSGAPIPFTLADDDSTTTTTTGISNVAESMVFREVLLADTVTPSTRIFTVTGGTISSGTEQLFVNGILQSLGASNDYIISGNTITFTYDLEAGDTVVISYVKG